MSPLTKMNPWPAQERPALQRCASPDAQIPLADSERRRHRQIASNCEIYLHRTANPKFRAFFQ